MRTQHVEESPLSTLHIAQGICLRPAGINDVPQVQRLINGWATKGQMLPRSLHSLYEHLRDYVVAEQEGRVVGCTGLHIMWDDLAEIRSLAVDESYSGLGVGSSLVRWALSDAASYGISRVFVLTFVPHFFAKIGFWTVEKSELPHKIWQECIHCVHFPDCNEVALVTDLPPVELGSK